MPKFLTFACFTFGFISAMFWLSNSALGDAPFSLMVKPDHDTGVYAPGEKVTWLVDIRGDRSGLTALSYRVRKDALVDVTTGTLDLSAGPATITASRDEPGALLAEIFPTNNFNALPLAMGGRSSPPKKSGLLFRPRPTSTPVLQMEGRAAKGESPAPPLTRSFGVEPSVAYRRASRISHSFQILLFARKTVHRFAFDPAYGYTREPVW